jgi:hypothetical protein
MVIIFFKVAGFVLHGTQRANGTLLGREGFLFKNAIPPNYSDFK